MLFAVFNLLFPKVGFAFNCAAFIIGIVFLSQTSSSVEYFRVIYLESLLIPYYRFKGKITQLYKDVPTEIRKKFRSRKVETFSIGKNERKWYFKDNWKCLELFDLNGPEENIIRLFKKPERKLAFVVSREYEAIFTDVTAGMGAIDYNALKAKLTEERRIHMEKDNKAFYAITQ